jgi:hypothetical protein
MFLRLADPVGRLALRVLAVLAERAVVVVRLEI